MAGLLLPFIRDRKRDFASASGAELDRTKVKLILGTEGPSERAPGELVYMSSFGSLLQQLRHAGQVAGVEEVYRALTNDALKTWAPGLVAKHVVVVPVGTRTRVTIYVNRMTATGQSVYDKDLSIETEFSRV
jgi:uncharacterized protein